METETKTKVLYAVGCVSGFLLVAALGFSVYLLFVRDVGENNDDDSIDVSIGEENDEVVGGDVDDSMQVDPGIEYETYENLDWGITFEYQDDWVVDTSIDNTIRIKIGEYYWDLTVDPIVTGGGWGYLLDGLSLTEQDERYTAKPGGYSVDMVAKYYDLPADFTDGDLKENVWGGTVAWKDFSGMKLGFGLGEMYDDIDNNFFSIIYGFDIYSGGDTCWTCLPVKDDAELEKNLEIMDRMTNSVVIE